MEVRDFALRIVRTQALGEKLSPPAADLTDDRPGPALVLDAPGRPARLAIAAAREARVPSIHGLHDVQQKVRILHALANHELQATELFAWALLAFPEAPREFRRGLLRVLLDEQRHTRMYNARLSEWHVELGDFPVSAYFWSKAVHLTSPLRFICAMSLTFENANLDHTLEYAEAAERLGDSRTAALLRQVHRDEIEHVRFGWRWLHRFKTPGMSPWEAYRRNLTWPLRAALARGGTFDAPSRRAAGLDDETIRGLSQATREESASAKSQRTPLSPH